jgi:4-hydroxy-4-methyl-2-oxoglutarate aldolase
MRPWIGAAIVLLAFFGTPLGAQDNEPVDEEILALYDGLRVADVSDGMDVAGLRDVGLVDRRIQAFWKDIEAFDHQFRGIAITARYMPHQEVVPNPMPQEEFSAWEGQWYTELSAEPFVEHIRPGTVVVIDASGNGDTGSIGSYNSLDWVARGAVGIVTTGSARDTDEIIKQRIPLYMDPLQRGRGIRPGRNIIESVNEPVELGGVLVRPGDVVVADGDGVIVVPRAHAVAVAEAARRVLDADMAGRRALYERLGRPLDHTVAPDSAGGSGGGT